MRSILTMLGIIIGVGAVIIVVAIGQGGEQMIKSEITGASNTVDVYYQPPEDEMQADDLSMTGSRSLQRMILKLFRLFPA